MRSWHRCYATIFTLWLCSMLRISVFHKSIFLAYSNVCFTILLLMQDFAQSISAINISEGRNGGKKDSIIFFTTAQNERQVLHFIWVIKFWIIKLPSGFSELISANSQTSHAAHSQAGLVFGAGEWMGSASNYSEQNTPSCGMPKRELRINLWANCNANAGRMVTPAHTRAEQKSIKFTFAILVILRQVSEKRPKWSSLLQIETSHVLP